MPKNELIYNTNNFDYSKYRLDNNQVIGLIDSDGNFSVWQRKDKFSPIFIFKVSQRDYSVELLKALKAHFKVGHIRLENEKTGSLMYAVTDRNDLRNVIIPFIDKFPLVTSKALDYQDWKKALLMCMDGNPTADEIDIIRAGMNRGRSFEDRWNYSAYHSNLDRLTEGWIVGFIEGDGSFQYGFKGFMPTIQITQGHWHRPLIKKIRAFLNAGNLRPSDKFLNKHGYFTTEDMKNLKGKIDFRINGNGMTSSMFPIIDKFNLYSWKGRRYQLLKQIIELGRTISDLDKRRLALEPLVKALQRKHSVNPNSPYRQLPKLEEANLITPEDLKELEYDRTKEQTVKETNDKEEFLPSPRWTGPSKEPKDSKENELK